MSSFSCLSHPTCDIYHLEQNNIWLGGWIMNNQPPNCPANNLSHQKSSIHASVLDPGFSILLLSSLSNLSVGNRHILQCLFRKLCTSPDPTKIQKFINLFRTNLLAMNTIIHPYTSCMIFNVLLHHLISHRRLCCLRNSLSLFWCSAFPCIGNAYLSLCLIRS